MKKNVNNITCIFSEFLNETLYMKYIPSISFGKFDVCIISYIRKERELFLLCIYFCKRDKNWKSEQKSLKAVNLVGKLRSDMLHGSVRMKCSTCLTSNRNVWSLNKKMFEHFSNSSNLSCYTLLNYFLQAHKRKMYGGKYVWILAATTSGGWVFSNETFAEQHKSIDCAYKDVVEAAKGFLTISNIEIRQDNQTTTSGLVSIF